MKIILLTGASGQVGWELQRTLAPLGKVVAPSSAELDLADPDSLRRTVRQIKPELIVNAAAYTAVDKAETEPGLAMAINGIAPGILGEEARRLDARLIHFSTDYVFDGSKNGAYVEDDMANPLNVYGATKLAGERNIDAAGIPALILRTSWVYGLRGRNFLITMLRLGRERDFLRVVSDQRGAPTWSRMIAEATAQILVRWNGSDGGIYHLTSAGNTSWHGFAQAIMQEYGKRQGGHGWPVLKAGPEAVEAISTENYPTPARRPMNSLLDNTRLYRDFGLCMPGWQDALELVLEEAANGECVRGLG